MLSYLNKNLALSLGLTLLFSWVVLLWIGRNSLTPIHNDDDGEHKPDIFETHYRDTIVVGVLSARENFEQREAIRQTWWPLNMNATVSKIRARFFVGRDPCIINPLDRLDEHDCSQWKLKIEDVEHGPLHRGVHLLVSNSVLDDRLANATIKLYSALQFRVMHAIVISKLGVINLVNSSNRKCIVTVLDAAMQTIVTQVIISSDGLLQGFQSGGYLYRSIEPVLLPQGFVGNIVVNIPNGNVDDNALKNFHFQYDLAGGLITISHVTDGDGRLDLFDETETIVAASFGYVVHDLPGLRSHVAGREQRQLEWKSKLEAEDTRLRAEMVAHDDVVLLDVLDTYRNLPTKLLAFYDWVVASSNFSCVVKTDDDTLLNLEQLTMSLADLLATFQNQPWWWGHFRQNWAVERHGKWRETTYRSLTYPPFACGSAYVISAHLVQWLSVNRLLLHQFQGEDVSMGIWLAPLNPRLQDDRRWSCADDCPLQNSSMSTLSRGQLKPAQMRTAWTSLVKCGNICPCS